MYKLNFVSFLKLCLITNYPKRVLPGMRGEGPPPLPMAVRIHSSDTH